MVRASGRVSLTASPASSAVLDDRLAAQFLQVLVADPLGTTKRICCKVYSVASFGPLVSAGLSAKRALVMSEDLTVTSARAFACTTCVQVICALIRRFNVSATMPALPRALVS